MFEAPLLMAVTILLAPLLGALWIAVGFVFDWNRGEPGESETAQSVIWSLSLSCLLLLGLDVYALLLGAPGTLLVSDWLASGGIKIEISLLLDGLSLGVASCFSLIILLVARFSVPYLHREAGFQRFFLALLLFYTGMMLIVLSGNIMLAFIGWELAGFSSYLLIAYAWQRPIATQNATRAFVTNRLGDAGFILALFTALTYLGTCEWGALFVAAKDAQSLIAGVIAVSLVLAALIKSAQFPFSSWIAGALEGPTPSSAVFYGSVMVHAGVYLLLRCAPLLDQLPFMSWLLLLAGGLTVAYSWLLAQTQTDIKSSLLFATLMQTGLMVMAIGLGWYDWATVHLVLHACWRAYQFLHAPSFMQLTQHAPPPPPRWLRQRAGWHQAALQRFWLDPLINWLLVKPTHALAQEAQLFDERIIDRITGTASHRHELSSLAQMEALQKGQLTLEHQVGVGSGLFGLFMQRAGEALQWVEERLVLKGSGDGLRGLASLLGARAELVESYLRQPRYLLVLIAATLVIIFNGTP